MNPAYCAFAKLLRRSKAGILSPKCPLYNFELSNSITINDAVFLLLALIRKMKLFSYIIVLFVFMKLHAQPITVEILKIKLENAKQDTERCKILQSLIESESDISIWSEYNRQLTVISTNGLKLSSGNSKLYYFYLKQLADSYNNNGFVAQEIGQYKKALFYHNNSLTLYKLINSKNGIATALNNIGITYAKNGESEKAIDYLLNGCILQSEMGDKIGVALSYNNLGSVFQKRGDIQQALNYYAKSLKINEELNDDDGIGYSLNNISGIYDLQGDTTKAIEYLLKCLSLFQAKGEKGKIALILNNIGLSYHNRGNDSKALEYYLKSLQIQENLADKRGIATCLNNIAFIYENRGKTNKLMNDTALKFYKKSLSV